VVFVFSATFLELREELTLSCFCLFSGVFVSFGLFCVLRDSPTGWWCGGQTAYMGWCGVCHLCGGVRIPQIVVVSGVFLCFGVPRYSLLTDVVWCGRGYERVVSLVWSSDMSDVVVSRHFVVF